MHVDYEKKKKFYLTKKYALVINAILRHTCVEKPAIHAIG